MKKKYNNLPLFSLALFSTLSLILLGCQKPAPAERPAVTLPVSTAGDVTMGKQQFEQDCAKCHRLKAGANEKGPQLLRVYGATAGGLADYQYSDALKNSHLIWTVDKLDSYIANPKQTVPDTKMKAEPITDSKERQNIIAYLSTLR